VDEDKHGPSPADYDSKAANGTEVGPEASGMNEPFVRRPTYFPVVEAGLRQSVWPSCPFRIASAQIPTLC